MASGVHGQWLEQAAWLGVACFAAFLPPSCGVHWTSASPLYGMHVPCLPDVDGASSPAVVPSQVGDGSGHGAYFWDQNATIMWVKLVGGNLNLEVRRQRGRVRTLSGKWGRSRGKARAYISYRVHRCCSEWFSCSCGLKRDAPRHRYVPRTQ